MATFIPISQTPLASSLSSTDLVVLVQSGGGGLVTRHTTLGALLASYYTTAQYTAAGTNAISATPLATVVCDVINIPIGAGVALPLAVAGTLVVVLARGANDLLVYPKGSAAVESSAVGSPVRIASGSEASFRCISAALWRAS